MNAKTMEVWLSIRDELRRLRGMNRFRGNEVHLLERDEIRLMQEQRGGQTATGYFVLHLTETHDGLWAEERPLGRKWRVAEDFQLDWKAWLRAMIDACRGSEYLQTSSERADYRLNGLPDKPQNSN